MVFESPSEVLQAKRDDPRKCLQHKQQKDHDLDLQSSTQHLQIYFARLATHQPFGGDDYDHQQQEDDNEHDPDREMKDLAAWVHDEVLSRISQTGHVFDNLNFVYQVLG